MQTFSKDSCCGQSRRCFGYVDVSKSKKIVPYLVIGLTIFSLLLKIDAHVVVGVENMIPNVEKGLTLALDIQSLGNYLPTYGISGRFDSFQRQTTLVEKEVTSKMTKNKDVVEQWLVDSLKGQNKIQVIWFD